MRHESGGEGGRLRTIDVRQTGRFRILSWCQSWVQKRLGEMTRKGGKRLGRGVFGGGGAEVWTYERPTLLFNLLPPGDAGRGGGGQRVNCVISQGRRRNLQACQVVGRQRKETPEVRVAPLEYTTKEGQNRPSNIFC